MAPLHQFVPERSGRITAHLGRLELINSQGTGKIRFVCSRGFTVSSKFGNAGSPFAAANGATGGCTEFPAKSTHSKKVAQFVSADTQRDLQDFRTGDLLA